MLNEAYNLLSDKNKERLQDANESGDSLWIDLGNNYYFGVNVSGVPTLNELESKGNWSYGTTK
jgi:hypothetical protein